VIPEDVENLLQRLVELNVEGLTDSQGSENIALSIARERPAELVVRPASKIEHAHHGIFHLESVNLSVDCRLVG
jgi:hypothetical protein